MWTGSPLNWQHKCLQVVFTRRLAQGTKTSPAAYSASHGILSPLILWWPFLWLADKLPTHLWHSGNLGWMGPLAKKGFAHLFLHKHTVCTFCSGCYYPKKARLSLVSNLGLQYVHCIPTPPWSLKRILWWNFNNWCCFHLFPSFWLVAGALLWGSEHSKHTSTWSYMASSHHFRP